MTLHPNPTHLLNIIRYTVCHPSIDASMLPRCDQLTGNVQHNGDDAIMLLEKNGQAVVDTFGAFGADPGSSWTVCGDTSATVCLFSKIIGKQAQQIVYLL